MGSLCLTKLIFVKTGKKNECEKYCLTTSAEFSSSEEGEAEVEVAPRQRKRKRYDDYVTGTSFLLGYSFVLLNIFMKKVLMIQ